MYRQSLFPGKPWWKDPATIGDIVISIVTLVVIVVSVVDILDVWSIKWFAERIPEITVGLLSILTLASVVERRFLIKRWLDALIQEVRESRIGPYQGLTSIYARRDHLPHFNELVRDATQEIFILGINLGYIALHQTHTLEDKATSGCKIRASFRYPLGGVEIGLHFSDENALDCQHRQRETPWGQSQG
jgi:hypothetical protein